MERIRAVPSDETQADQWQSQILARILEDFRVILISEAPDELVRSLHMLPVHSLEEAVSLADRLLGFPGEITVIPEGVSTIISAGRRR